MNTLKRIVYVFLVIINCSCGDDSDSPKLKVTLSSENITISGIKGTTVIQPLNAFVIDETNNTEVPDVEVTITSSVSPPTVVLRSEEEVSSSSSLVVTTDENGAALFSVEVKVDEEMEILITATINSSIDSLTITVSHEESCDEIRQMIGDEINVLNYCSNDSECIEITVINGCFWAAINASVNTEELDELQEIFIEKKCPIVCLLNVPAGVYCEEGKCKLIGY